MLTGEPLPGLPFRGKSLRMQASANGWLFDDVVAEGESNQGILAISCKNASYCTNSKLDDEISNLLAEAWTREEGPFNHQTDKLALITNEAKPAFDSIWRDLKDWTSGVDPALALPRIFQTAKHKTLFESVRGSKHTDVTDEELCRLVAHTEIIRRDFHAPNSRDLQLALFRCRALLANKDHEVALELWETLLQTAKDARIRHGFVELGELWNFLGQKFELVDHPSFIETITHVEILSASVENAITSRLPNGYVIERELAETFKTKLVNEQFVSIIGSSGTGKSSLVKNCASALAEIGKVVWLNAESWARLAEDRTTNLTQFAEAICMMNKSCVILVIDGLEQLDASRTQQLAEFLISIEEQSRASGKSVRYVLTSQTDKFASQVATLIQRGVEQFRSARLSNALQLDLLDEKEVRRALSASEKHQWLVAHPDVVTVLRHPMLLSWVLESEDELNIAEMKATAVSLADHIWLRWTNGSPPLQKMLIDLAKKEADYQRSFPISELGTDQLAQIERSRPFIPLKQEDNRFRFSHDLAADWARFQFLKERYEDWKSWAEYAKHPLWINALRLLGQFLLRKSSGVSSEWDRILKEMEKDNSVTSSAEGVLYDSLFLDPDALDLLSSRTEMLLAENGKRLQTLLRRFQHIATLPDPRWVSVLKSDLGVYLEATIRVPIWGRWPVLLGFLDRQKLEITALALRDVSKTCQFWLSSTASYSDPKGLYRPLAARVAIANAKQLQLMELSGVMIADDSERDIYEAPLHAANVLPDEVNSWALEMARRRDWSPEAQAALEKRKREREARLAEKPEQFRSDIGFPSPKKLPPWPLGPQGRVNRAFRAAMLENYGLRHFISTNPDIAAELLLALFIDDSPHEATSDFRLMHEELGLEHDQLDGRVAYWIGPFYAFFKQDPFTAQTCFRNLVNFCGAVWAQHEAATGRSDSFVTFRFDKELRNIVGDQTIYRIAYSSGFGRNAMFASALHALERWLYDQIDAGKDVSDTITELLDECNFLIVYSTLVNVGKYKPDLLKGPLRPLLTNWRILFLDLDSQDWAKYSFDSFSWTRQGNESFEMARNWYALEHRKKTLLEAIGPLIFEDKEFAKWMRSEVKNWRCPQDSKTDIELRAMAEQLDIKRYVVENGQPVKFSFSKSLQKKIDSFRGQNQQVLSDLTFHHRCEERLRNEALLSPEEIDSLWQQVLTFRSRHDLEELKREESLAAGLCLLICRGDRSSTEFEDIRSEVTTLLKSVFCSNVSPEVNADNHDPFRIKLSQFLALGVAESWLQAESRAEWNQYVVLIICYAEPGAVAALFSHLFPHRAAFYEEWYALIHLAVLRSALAPLRPLHFMDQPQAISRWNHWLFNLSRTPLTIRSQCSVLLPSEAEIRVRDFVKSGPEWRSKYLLRQQLRPFVRLDERRLLAPFECILLLSEPDSFNDEVVQSLADYVRRKIQSTTKDRREEHEYPDDFDRRIFRALAARSLLEEEPSRFWKPLLELGPQAHHSIERFMLELFTLAKGNKDAKLEACWREIMEFALSEEFPSASRGYNKQEALRAVMGLEHIVFIKAIPNIVATLTALEDHFLSWAAENLSKDSRNVSAFCRLLETQEGRPLAGRGIIEMARSLKVDGLGYWHKSDGTGDAICSLIARCLVDDADRYMNDNEVRQAVFELVAELVRKNVSASMQLQQKLGEWNA